MNRPPNGLEKFANMLTDNFVDTVLQMKQLPEEDWAQYNFPAALLRTLQAELELIDCPSSASIPSFAVNATPMSNYDKPSSQGSEVRLDSQASERGFVSLTVPPQLKSTDPKQNPGPYPRE